MGMPEMAVPAVVAGLGLNGLGVVRSLASKGVPVTAVDSQTGNPAMHTRYGRKVRVRAMHGDAFVEDLLALARSFSERPVLFLTEEATVRTVSARRSALESCYRITLPPAAILDSLMHKQSFQRLAERHDFRVPRSLHVLDDDTLEQARELRYPVVLKPGKKDAGYGRSFRKAYRLESFDELCRQSRQIMPVLPDLVVQEWIDGADSDVYFCLQYIRADGQPAASFSGRKIRSWPPAVGGTASCTAAPEAASAIEAETTRFFRATGFVGMGSMEFKHDAASGAFYLIEPTVGRTDYQEEVATLNGVNIPFAAYCAELGLAVPAFRPKSRPRVWREAATDLWSAELQHQRCGRGPLESGRRIDAWWRWNDPMPWIAKTGARLLKAGSRRLSFRRLRPLQEGEI